MPKNNHLSDFPKRYYLLDILRGLASLTVVLFHYQYFFYVAPGTPSDTFEMSQQPFYSLLFPLYENGPDAVYLFYVLSGFIFYHLYLTQIKDSKISVGRFFILRFSRLYPLHFLTLIFVAGMQILSLDLVGDYTVYPFNDLKHFLLNLTFTSYWGFEDGWSFNAPVWSVSIEVFLYGTFFLFAAKVGKSLTATVLMVLFGIVLVIWFRAIGVGVFCFYLGGMASIVYEDLRNSKLTKAGYLSISFAALGVTITMFLALTIDSQSALETLMFLPFVAAGPDLAMLILAKVTLYGAVFPTLIFFLACLQDWNHLLGRRLQVIGDITYSTYLLHFPLQLAIILSVGYFNISVNFLSPLALFFFLASVVGVSILSFKYVEMPSQRFLRSTGQRHLVRAAVGN